MSIGAPQARTQVILALVTALGGLGAAAITSLGGAGKVGREGSERGCHSICANVASPQLDGEKNKVLYNGAIHVLGTQACTNLCGEIQREMGR